MWQFWKKSEESRYGPIFFTNTLSGKKEVFVPLKPGIATLYSCGPTVYSKQHIGNLKAPLFGDLVARVLKSNGYRVRRAINITDVGHLVGDGDEGEDKMEVGSKKEGKTAQEVAAHYTKLFLDDIQAINMDTSDILFPHATQYIPEQIAMVQALESKGFVYRTHDGMYFDTSKFPGYGKLGSIPQEFIKDGTAADVGERVALAGRARIKQNLEKRNPADFALWKFSALGVVRQQEWPSPWGRGFPGWHIECSAMNKALLGETIDIHTGGIDHIPVHHNNEIAQSENANGKPLARYWLHEAFVNVNDEKIAKSVGNVVYLSDIIERGYHPLALRYFFLQANYRSPMSFTWDALEAANEALTRLWRIARELKTEAKEVSVSSATSERIRTLLRDDLATPKALALLWETVRDEDLSPRVRYGAMLAADEVLGLSLAEPPFLARTPQTTIPTEIQKLSEEREAAREARDFARADELRIHMEKRGYAVEDSPTGPVIVKK
ncbi:MAG: cysteine--tRNA ligase [Patescibacteria group bacterium]